MIDASSTWLTSQTFHGSLNKNHRLPRETLHLTMLHCARELRCDAWLHPRRVHSFSNVNPRVDKICTEAVNGKEARSSRHPFVQCEWSLTCNWTRIAGRTLFRDRKPCSDGGCLEEKWKQNYKLTTNWEKKQDDWMNQICLFQNTRIQFFSVHFECFAPGALNRILNLICGSPPCYLAQCKSSGTSLNHKRPTRSPQNCYIFVGALSKMDIAQFHSLHMKKIQTCQFDFSSCVRAKEKCGSDFRDGIFCRWSFSTDPWPAGASRVAASFCSNRRKRWSHLTEDQCRCVVGQILVTFQWFWSP